MHQQKVERAIVAFCLKQTVKTEKGCQQRTDPDNGWPDTRQKVEVRSNAEGNDGNHGEEEQHADQCAAAGANGKFHVAKEKGGHHQVSSVPENPVIFSSWAWSSPRGWCVAAMIIPSLPR